MIRAFAAQFLAGAGIANDDRRPRRIEAERIAYGVDVMALGGEGAELGYLGAGGVVSRHGVFTRHGQTAAERQQQGGADCIFHR